MQSKDMYVRVMRRKWRLKKKFMHFRSIARHLHDVCMNICTHYPKKCRASKRVDTLRPCSVNTQGLIQGPKTNFKYFQGLEIRLLRFKGFKDTYKP